MHTEATIEIRLSKQTVGSRGAKGILHSALQHTILQKFRCESRNIDLSCIQFADQTPCITPVQTGCTADAATKQVAGEFCDLHDVALRLQLGAHPALRGFKIGLLPAAIAGKLDMRREGRQDHGLEINACLADVDSGDFQARRPCLAKH